MQIWKQRIEAYPNIKLQKQSIRGQISFGIVSVKVKHEKTPT